MESVINSQTISTTRHRELTDRVNRFQATPTFIRVFILVAAGMFMDAIDVYLASGVSSYMLASKWSTVAQNSTFLSAGFMGLFIGSITAGLVGDIFGRRRAYQLNLLIFGFFTLIEALAPNVIFLIVCRLIAAIGLGTEIVTGYAMINEFAPIKQRGRWCAATSLIANCGAPITMLMCTIIIPRFSWRAMFVISGALALILWYFRRNLPESPRWNINHHNYDEAEETIAMIEGEMKNKGATPADIQATTETTGKNENDRHLTRNMIVAIVAVTAVIVCQYTFTSWVPTLLVQRGIEVTSSLGFSTVMMLGAPVGAFIGTTLVDKVGRKPTIISAFVLAAVLGIAYAYQTSSIGVMVIGFALTACFYVLMAVVVAVYTSELFSTTYRFRGAGIANGISKLVTIGMPYAVAWMLTTVGSTTIFFTIAGMAIVAATVVMIWGPETNQRVI
ncbi:MFS transporter [Limosilactobacillus fermentum]